MNSTRADAEVKHDDDHSDNHATENTAHALALLHQIPVALLNILTRLDRAQLHVADVRFEVVEDAARARDQVPDLRNHRVHRDGVARNNLDTLRAVLRHAQHELGLDLRLLVHQQALRLAEQRSQNIAKKENIYTIMQA